MSDRQVKLVLDGKTGEASPVDTGIPQGSPAAPILFVTYLSGIFGEVESAVLGIRGLSFVDDIGWWADGADDAAVAAKLSEAAAASIDRAASNGVALTTGRRRRQSSEGKVPSHGSGEDWHQHHPIQQGGDGVWLDSQLTLKDHHAIRMKSGKNVMARLRRLAGQEEQRLQYC